MNLCTDRLSDENRMMLISYPGHRLSADYSLLFSYACFLFGAISFLHTFYIFFCYLSTARWSARDLELLSTWFEAGNAKMVGAAEVMAEDLAVCWNFPFV